jgi:hypothetical protein
MNFMTWNGLAIWMKLTNMKNHNANTIDYMDETFGWTSWHWWYMEVDEIGCI